MHMHKKKQKNKNWLFAPETYSIKYARKERIKQALNWSLGLTLAGCEKPIDAIIIIRKKTRSEAFPKELQELGLKPMTGLEIYPPPDGSSPCESRCLEAQPL
jgi:hypothetical protein